jgi:hypothetical protein
MGRADDAANKRWKVAALYAVWMVALECEDFTTDEVSKYMEKHWPDIATHEPRALGPIMTTAARKGYCENTRKQRLTEKAVAHRRGKNVWKSLIWTP